MKPFRLRSLGVAACFLAAAETTQATATINLEATVLYTAAGDCTGSTTGKQVLVTAAVPSGSCTGSTTCAETPSGTSLYPAVECSTTDGTATGAFIQTDLPRLFGSSSPYVVVESYTSATNCAAATDITSITAYLADGKCHKTDAAASYRATRKADGSATVQPYNDATCTLAGTLLTVSAVNGAAHSCVSDTKWYGAGTTPLYLTSTVNYDTTSNTCSSGVPTLVSTAVGYVDTCTASVACTGSADPYTGTKCSSVSSYQSDMATAFSTSAYIIVELYTSGQSCVNTQLSSITTYLADGKCHKTSSTTSYRAARKADNSATVQPYTDALCGTAGMPFSVSAADGTNHACVSDKKWYGDNLTPLYLTSTVNYDSTANTCSSGVPSLVSTAVGTFDTCTSTVSCTGSAAPYTGTKCSSVSSYQSDMATAFPSTPYISVEAYNSGQACAATQLSGITTYLADGKCHKSGQSTSYRAARKADNSATVQLYTDALCGTSGTLLSVSAADGTNHACASDKKWYGADTTPLYLTSTVNYDTTANTCSSGVPSLVSTAVGNVDTCVATNVCTGSAAPYSGTKCYTVASYQTDMATAFGVNPYLIVQTYTAGQSCADTALTGITTYSADGKCHKTGSSTSYRVTRNADTSATIKTYTDATCTTGETSSSVGASQGAACTTNTKVYGGGATPKYLSSTVSYETNTNLCKSGLPSYVSTAPVAVDTCTATTTCTGQAAPYTGTSCSSALTYRDDMAAAFGVNPYVIVQTYTAGQSCADTALTGITTYLADGKCHKTGSSTSYRVTRNADTSATIKTYTDATCTTGETSSSVGASQGAACTTNTKVYGGGATPKYLSSTVSYETNTNLCKSGLPSYVSTAPVAVDTCTATTTCTGQAAPYTGTSCSSALTYRDDMAAAFGVNPYVIVQTYTAGQSCADTALTGITTYLADGKCHKTGSSGSYRVTRSADNSASIKIYTDAACTTGVVTTPVSAGDGTSNACVSDTKVYGAGATPKYLSSTVSYETNANSCKSGLPSYVSTALAPVDTCTATTTCTGLAAPYTGTSCSSALTYRDDMAAAFGVNPYVIVQTYTAGQSCADTALTGITTYLADGKCHKTGSSGSYRATRNADNSASIKIYTDAACITGVVTTPVSAGDGTSNACVSDTKVYGGGATPLYLSSTVSYDTNTNTCKSGLPSYVSTAPVAVDTCTATTTCTGQAAPYTGTSCSSALTYKDDMAAAFGVNPYVIVETYNAGQSCAAAQLFGVTTYLADNKCHKTGSATSYRVTRSADNSASIKTFSDATCGTVATTLPVTAAQTANSCTSGATGIADTKVYYGGSATPLYISSTMNYDTTVNSCKSGVPTSVSSTVVPVDTCSATTTCTGLAAPYTGTSCSSALTYRDDMAAAFGVNPYVIVQTYTAGQSCADTALTGITTYLADGKCHKTGSSGSYRVTRSADNSASIKIYTDAACTTGVVTTPVSAGDGTSNACVSDTKVYGAGATPKYLSSTVSYETNANSCKSGLPSYVTTIPTTVDTCTATTTCTGQAVPYTGTSCSSTLTYKEDMAAAFGSIPYVIVEKYTAAQSCAADNLASITTYLADGKCHKTGTSASYRATRNADNSANIQPYTDAVCGTAGVALSVTAGDGTSNACVSDSKVYGAGTTPLYLTSTVSYETNANSCKSGPPSYVTTSAGAFALCVPSSVCTGQSAPYTGTSCSSTLTYKEDIAAAFGSNPYLIVEKYTAGQSCAADKLSSIVTYSADGKCHKSSSTTSYRAIRKVDNSATIKTYTDAVCGTGEAVVPVTASQGTSNACTSDSKVYGAGTTPLFLTSTVNYDTNANSCKSGVPSYVTASAGSFAVCVPSTECTGQGAPYTGTSCGSTLTYKDDMAAAFGSNPYVIVEKYNSAQSCAAAELSTITTYLADGKCHKTGSSTSYRATRKADGSATVQPYTDGVCGAAGTLLTVTNAQGTAHSCFSDTKVYGAGTTPLYLTSTVNYDTDATTCTSGVPLLVVSAVGNTDTCTATAACSGQGPYTGTSCSTVSSYKSDIAAAFGTSPFVIVKKYNSGKKCAAAELSSITTYLADGKCHKTGSSTSYVATRSAGGSAVIQPYTDATCGTAGTRITVTAAQTANSCAADANGIVDTKVYGSGKTATVYSSAYSFDTNTNNCQSGLPIQVVTAKADVSTCPASTTCSGQAAPYTGTKCGSTLTYKEDIAAAFGSNPYLIVEKYNAGLSCAAAELSGITTYLADGKCHKTSATTSYRATRDADNSASIKTYTDAACTTGVVTLSVSASDGTSNACVADTKVFGGGATPKYLSSTVNYDTSTNSCKSGLPSYVATTVVAVDVCAATTACATQAAPFTGTSCSSTLTYKDDMAAAFGSNPYVIVEKYNSAQSCAAAELSTITTYLADGKCHKTGSSTSYRATRKADGSATVQPYTDGVCGAAGTLLTVTNAQGTAHSCFSDTKVYGAGTTPLYLTSTVNYDTDATTCTTGVPSFVSTAVANVDTTCANTNACTGSAAPYTGTKCSSVSSYQSDMAAAFGLSSYIVVEKYNAGQACAATELYSITTYLADGKCHKTGSSTSYAATRSADGSAVIQPYTDATCGTAGTRITVTAAQTANSCAADANGIVDTKVYGSGKTATVYSSAYSFDTNTNNCQSGLPIQVVTAKADVSTCPASTTCSGQAAPYTGTKCGSTLTYKEDIAAAFGSNPYLIVEKYNAGLSCAAAELSGITTYLADGKCHKTGSSTSYRVTRNADTSATIKTYTDATCTTGETSSSVGASQGAACTTNTKVYGGGATPKYLSSTVSYETNTNLCKSGLPSYVSTAPVAVDTCTATTTCTGQAAPYTGTSCSSALTYRDDMAAAFGVNPYVIVQTYTAGQSCADTALTGITTYSADGKCHKTGSSTSYRATRSADNSAAIKTYTDAACTTGETLASIGPSQQTNNACTGDTKVYGAGTTPQYLSSTVTYDTTANSCKLGLPLLVTTAPVAVDACSVTTTCTGQAAPYTGTSCSSTQAYKDDMAAAFGSNPYVIVETYNAGQSCAAAQLSGITTYLADGKCHKTDTAKSYLATRKPDGSASVQAFTDAVCGAAGALFTVNAADGTARTCVSDTKIYGFGATGMAWSAVAISDSKTCTAPTQITLSSQFSCVDAGCFAFGDRSISYTCGNDYIAATKKAFGSLAPFIVVEVYKDGTACGVMEGVMAFVADTKCHQSIDGSSSFTVTLATDGSGTMLTYEDKECKDATPFTTPLTKEQLSSHQCFGSAKYYAFNVPTPPTIAPATVAPPTTPSTEPTTAPPTAPTSAPTSAPPTGSGSANTGDSSGAAPLSTMSTLIATCLCLVGWMAGLLL